MADDTRINVSETLDAGAEFIPKYYAATHDIVGVPEIDIEDSVSSSK